jgi:hypothetical protein
MYSCRGTTERISAMPPPSYGTLTHITLPNSRFTLPLPARNY